jgi:hypothetical protein
MDNKQKITGWIDMIVLGLGIGMCIGCAVLFFFN